MPHLPAIALSALLAFPFDTPIMAPLPLTAAEAHELLTSPLRRVRALDPRLDALLASGVHRSTTLGYLLAALQQTDVIVQIVAASAMPLSTPARLRLIPNPKAFRFLRIDIRVEGSDDDLIALLGHELRHAFEIGQEDDVRDDQALIALYQRIGHRDIRGDFDTDAAHTTARQIRRELYVTAAVARASRR